VVLGGQRIPAEVVVVASASVVRGSVDSQVSAFCGEVGPLIVVAAAADLRLAVVRQFVRMYSPSSCFATCVMSPIFDESENKLPGKTFVDNTKPAEFDVCHFRCCRRLDHNVVENDHPTCGLYL
jgi:hypothetical protein